MGPTSRALQESRGKSINWLRRKDPGGLQVKRSARAAIVVPCAFGLAHLGFADPQVSLFAAFGSFSLLLLVDFQGRPRTRLTSYLVLLLVGALLVALGTAVSQQRVASIAAMAVVGFVVLYAGVASSSVATASTATLLLFVLPVAVAAPLTELGARLTGLGIAGALCIPACLVLWPPPWHDELRRRLSGTMAALSHFVGAQASGLRDPASLVALQEELSSLRRHLTATPYPHAGAARRTVALVTLAGRLEWVAEYAMLASKERVALDAIAGSMLSAVAETLRDGAALVCDQSGHPVDDSASIRRVRSSATRLLARIDAELDAEVSDLSRRPAVTGDTPAVDDPRVHQSPQAGLAASLDPAYRVRAVGVATAMAADADLEAAGAAPIGDRIEGATHDTGVRRLAQSLRSHLSFRSVWLRNAVRGAVGLTFAIAIVEYTNVEHGFWVVLGTLSVLRSSALGTGSTALRAIAGTVVGFVVGSVIMIALAGHLVLLWLILPFAVLVAGTAPAMISFAAGQAGFTVVVIILFNIIAPAGWRVGLTRIEDVTIGCAVSVVVGLLFWPRGATAALGRALAEAFDTASRYLADVVDGLTLPVSEVDAAPAGLGALLSHLRLDDAFRQFLTERGAKVVPAETVASLFTGANRIRMAALTLASIPVGAVSEQPQELESVTLAGAVLRDSFDLSHRWYAEFAELLADRRAALDAPPEISLTVRDVLQVAFEDAQRRHREDQLRGVLRMLWAEELLEMQQQIQAELVRAADSFVSLRRGRFMI